MPNDEHRSWRSIHPAARPTRRRTESSVHRIGPELRVLEGRTVVVVDDHEDTRLLFVECLEWHGARALGCLSVRDALTTLAAEPDVDVVLTDLAMPEENGFVLIEAMLAHPRWRAIPTVIASGQDADDEAARRVPDTVYLSKPVPVDELVRVIYARCVESDGILLDAGES